MDRTGVENPRIENRDVARATDKLHRLSVGKRPPTGCVLEAATVHVRCEAIPHPRSVGRHVHPPGEMRAGYYDRGARFGREIGEHHEAGHTSHDVDLLTTKLEDVRAVCVVRRSPRPS